MTSETPLAIFRRSFKDKYHYAEQRAKDAIVQMQQLQEIVDRQANFIDDTITLSSIGLDTMEATMRSLGEDPQAFLTCVNPLTVTGIERQEATHSVLTMMSLYIQWLAARVKTLDDIIEDVSSIPTLEGLTEQVRMSNYADALPLEERLDQVNRGAHLIASSQGEAVEYEPRGSRPATPANSRGRRT